MTDQQVYQPPPNTTAPQSMAVAPAPPPDDPHAFTRRILFLVLAFIIVVGLGTVVGRAVLNQSSGKSGQAKTGRTDLGGQMMGVFLKNGTAYFGEGIYEDEETILLRDIYISLGFFPRSKGGPPVLQVARLNEGNPDAPKEQVIRKEEILFSSHQVHPDIIEAIQRYVPPTPTPVPVETSSPSPGPEETTPVPASPSPAAEERTPSGFGI